MDLQEPMLTTEDVANYLKVDVVTVRRLVSRGELAAYRIGGEYRFSQHDLRDYLQRQYQPAEAGPSLPSRGAEFFRELIIGGRGLRAPGTRRRDAWEAFTLRAKNALDHAAEIATQRAAASVETGHLLLGLLRERGGIAAQALSGLDVTAERIEQALSAQPAAEAAAEAGAEQPAESGEAASPGSQALSAAESRAVSPGVKRALRAAIDQSHRLGSFHVGTEHLLLGLLAEPDGQAVAALRALDIDPETLRKRIFEVVSAK